MQHLTPAEKSNTLRCKECESSARSGTRNRQSGFIMPGDDLCREGGEYKTRKGNKPTVYVQLSPSRPLTELCESDSVRNSRTHVGVAMIHSAPNPIAFTFSTDQMRVIFVDGEPWFVAADVCAILGISNNRDAIGKLDADEKGVGLTDTLGGRQKLTVVSEPGLYTLILRCRNATKPGTVAHRFRRWVTGEVLPALRKTGSYTVPTQASETITGEQLDELNHEISRITVGWLFDDGEAKHVHNHLRVAFGIRRLEDLPADQFDSALALVQSKTEACNQALSFVSEFRHWFSRECLSGNTPWTPAIRARLTRMQGERVKLPPRVDWLSLANQTNTTIKPHSGAEQ